jgi:hypothetical protein
MNMRYLNRNQNIDLCFGHFMKFILAVSYIMMISMALVFVEHASAQAPLRPGQSYTEGAKCAQSGVIFCEDFNYPSNFYCGPFGYNSGQYKWYNPGFTSSPTSGVYCQSSSIQPAANFSPQPSGSPPGGYVKMVNLNLGMADGTDFGCIRGDCDRNTSDSGNYANGLPITNDLYFRFQIYFSSDYVWPTYADNKILFLYPDRYTGKTDANVDAGFFLSAGQPFCPSLNRSFNDAINFRVGSNSCGYKTFPADADNTNCGFNEHFEYCNGVITTTPPNDTPTLGRLFRFNKSRWYTVEFRYKLSSPGVRNGTIEAWINGVKIYSANDLETCGNYGSSQGSCLSISEIFLSSWFNPFSNDKPKGYTLIDNLIISKNYIGPPSGSSLVDATPPAAPTNLTAK